MFSFLKLLFLRLLQLKYFLFLLKSLESFEKKKKGVARYLSLNTSLTYDANTMLHSIMFYLDLMEVKVDQLYVGTSNNEFFLIQNRPNNSVAIVDRSTGILFLLHHFTFFFFFSFKISSSRLFSTRFSNQFGLSNNGL